MTDGPSAGVSGSEVPTAETVPPPPTAAPSAARRQSSPIRLAAVACGLLALLSRLPFLGRPSVLVFDEVFYAADAADLVVEGVVQGRPAHPPLGTMLIAAGVRVLGFDTWGWRAVPLLAGAAVVALAVLLAGRVTSSTAAASLTGVVVAADGIAFVTGRLALLDGLLALLTTGAVVVLVGGVSRTGDAPGHRRAVWGASLLVGMAIAVKWSAAVLVPVVAVTGVLLDLSVFARGDRAMARIRRRRVVATVAIAVGAPVGVYLTVHVPWLVQYEQTDRAAVTCGEECGLGDRLGGLVDRHTDLLEFHTGLRPDNRYVGSSATWFTQSRPTGLYVERCGRPATDPRTGVCSPDADEGRAVVLAAGNPLVWLAGLPALGLALVVGVRRRAWPAVVTAAGVLALVVPWLLDRQGFSFYAAPVVPLVATLVVWSVTLIEPRSRRRGLGLALGLVAVCGLAWSYPLLTAQPLSGGVADLLGTWPGWMP